MARMSNTITHNGARTIWSRILAHPLLTSGGAMITEALRDVTRVMETLTPEQNEMLDQWGRQVQSLVNTAVVQGGPAGGRGKKWVNGVWLGHALHPALTDVPIGAWFTGALL